MLRAGLVGRGEGVCASMTGDHASCGSCRQRGERVCESLTGDHALCGSYTQTEEGGVCTSLTGGHALCKFSGWSERDLVWCLVDIGVCFTQSTLRPVFYQKTGNVIHSVVSRNVT